jgi:TolA-binding protein
VKILLKKLQNISITLIIGFFIIFSYHCAYFNTFYNAEQYFKEGKKELENAGDGKISIGVRKKFNSAIEKANKVLADYPDSRWTDNASYIIAMSNYYKMDFSAAKKNFEEYFASYPASELRSQAEIWYGRCLWKLGEKELALHQLNRSVRRVKNPEMKAEIFFAIAELYQSSNVLDSALQYYGQTTKTGRDLPIAAQAQFNIAEIYLLKNQIDLAIDNLKNVSKYSPTNELKDRMQVLLARIYRESGKFDEARELINTKLNNISNENIWGDLEYQLGLLYIAEGDLEAASLRFSQITEKYSGKPVSAEAYYQLGILNMVRFHDYEKAQKHFSQVKREDKNSRYAFDAQNKASEVKRFFNIQKQLKKAWEIIEPFDRSLRGIIDNTKISLEDDMRPEDLKKAIELHEEEQRKNIDTSAVYNDYYKSLYEIAELYYFNFKQVDSAVTYFNKINKSKYFNMFRDKTLYALYYLFDAEGDSIKSCAHVDSLKLLYPDSPYLAFIEKRESVIPSEEIIARQIFLDGEKLFEVNVDSSIAVFNSIYTQYPKTYYAEKSVLSIAWIYHHKYYNLDNAIKWYDTFINQYPESDNINFAQSAYNTLDDILLSLNASPPDTTSREQKDLEEEASEEDVPIIEEQAEEN